MTDIYQPYRDLLAGKDVPITANEPYPGRYKMKRGDAWLPVAIGPDGNGGIAALVDGVAADPLEIWTWAAKWPVSQDDYRFRVAKGHWPSEPKPVVRSNMPADPLEALLAEIDDKSKQAGALLSAGIKTQTDCDLARNMQAQLLALNKRADAMHKDEKAPVLEAERKIEAKFAFRKTVSAIADKLRLQFGHWMAAEERRQREATQREFEAKQAAVKAEQERISAAFVAKVRDDPVAALTDPNPVLPEMPTAPEPVRIQAGGGFGRRSGLRSEWVGVVEDHKQALTYFAEHPDVVALVAKLVKKAVKDSKGAVKIPGVKVVEDRKAA